MFQPQVFLPPIIALLGLAFLFNAILRKFHDARHEQIAFGILFGATVVIGMTNPLTLGEGLIFDTRTLLLGAAVVFVGPIAGLITLGFGLSCRVLIGGAGMVSGLVGLVLAFAIALVWSKYAGPRIKNAILRDFAAGIALSFSVTAFFLLPFDLAIELVITVLPTLLVVNTLGTVAIGLVFRREKKHFAHNKELEAHAETDALTNLLNRRGMDSAIEAKNIDRSKGHALFYFDIDNFKAVNDTYGHGAGDAALAIVAARIRDSIRGETVFSRHGGDEFSIYMPRLEATDVQAVADRIRTTVSNQAFTYNDTSFAVSISIGAFWSNRKIPVQDMIDRADAQLLLAKQAGKNRAQVAYDAPCPALATDTWPEQSRA